MSCSEKRRNPKQAVVVVPVYKTELDGPELASFIHNADVLKAHDVVAVYPKGLELSFYKEIAPNVKYQEFRKNDFSSVNHYNSLLTSRRFYEAFSDYEYLLICHFDAWVFRDELAAWCDKGYDYIGAPFVEPFVGQLSSMFPFLHRLYLNKVGNGGFCLRKISTHIAVTDRLSWLSPLCLKVMHEDIFFTLVVPLFFRRFRRPGADEANRFAVDKKARECVEKLDGQLPFGCHGWFKRNQDLWARHINYKSTLLVGERHE